MAICEVDGCPKPVGQARKCYMHFGRLRHHGTTDDPRRPWSDRFWQKVDKSGDCWIWTAVRDRRGYGLLGGAAPHRAAHRLSYLLAYGDPGDGFVLHRCDNPPCVRPEHLFLGDNAANFRDMVGKKRSAWGERSGAAKLTEQEVREIRRLVGQGLAHRDVANRYGVSRTTVSDIARRHSWFHLAAD